MLFRSSSGGAGLVGIALGSSNIRWHNSSLWVAFATKEDRDKALHRLHGAVFLRMDVALYLEEGERGKGKKEWRWLEMSRVRSCFFAFLADWGIGC